MSIVPSPYATGQFGGFAGANGGGGTGVPGLPADSYYADPNTGPIAQNIGTALFGNAQTMQQRALGQSEIARNQAQTQGLTQSNQYQADAHTALGNIGAMFSVPDGKGGMRPLTFQEMQAKSPQITQGLISAFPGNPEMGANAARLFAGMAGNPQMISNTFAGAGGAYTSTPVGQQVAEAAATGRTGIMAGAGIQEANINQTGAMNRQVQAQGNTVAHQYDAPVNAGAGSTTLFNAKDPRGKMGTPIYGAPQQSAPPGTPADGTLAQPPAPGPQVGSMFTSPVRFSKEATQAEQGIAYINSLPDGPAKDAARREYANSGVVSAETRAAATQAVSAGHDQAHVEGIQLGDTSREGIAKDHDQTSIANTTTKVNAPKQTNAQQDTFLNNELDAQLSNGSMHVDGLSKNAIAARAGELLKPGVPAQAAVQQAIQEYLAASPPAAPKGWGNLFQIGRTQTTVPPGFGASPAGTPQAGGIVPALPPAAAVASPQAGAGMPRPQTQQDYNAIPLGSQYIGSDGNVRTKTAGGA